LEFARASSGLSFPGSAQTLSLVQTPIQPLRLGEGGPGTVSKLNRKLNLKTYIKKEKFSVAIL